MRIQAQISQYIEEFTPNSYHVWALISTILSVLWRLNLQPNLTRFKTKWCTNAKRNNKQNSNSARNQRKSQEKSMKGENKHHLQNTRDPRLLDRGLILRHHGDRLHSQRSGSKSTDEAETRTWNSRTRSIWGFSPTIWFHKQGLGFRDGDNPIRRITGPSGSLELLRRRRRRRPRRRACFENPAMGIYRDEEMVGWSSSGP